MRFLGIIKMLVMVGLLMCIGSEISGHGVSGDLTIEEMRVRVDVRYSGGDPMAGQPWWIVGASDQVLLSGTTDADGAVFFSPDLSNPHRLIVKDSQGHRLRMEIDKPMLIRAIEQGQIRSKAAQSSTSQKTKESVSGTTSRVGEKTPWVSVVSGIGYILALASVGNWWLKQREHKAEGK